MSMPYIPRDRSDDYEEEVEAVFQILGITMMGWSEPCTLYDFTYESNEGEQRRQFDALFRCPWSTGRAAGRHPRAGAPGRGTPGGVAAARESPAAKVAAGLACPGSPQPRPLDPGRYLGAPTLPSAGEG